MGGKKFTARFPPRGQSRPDVVEHRSQQKGPRTVTAVFRQDHHIPHEAGG